MSEKRWVIDASMSYGGLLCFCPLEGDLDGDYQIVTGLNYLSERAPNEGRVVAIVHPDGQDAVDTWCEANAATLAAAVPQPEEPRP